MPEQTDAGWGWFDYYRLRTAADYAADEARAEARRADHTGEREDWTRIGGEWRDELDVPRPEDA